MSARAILIVEDDDHVREFLILALRAQGHEVFMAEQVEEARRIIFARPDADNLCLIVDVVLRNESGVDFAQEMLLRYPRFQVLLISGFTDDVVLSEHEMGDRLRFLPKPFTREELITAVDRLGV